MDKVRLFHKNDIIIVIVLLLLAVAGLFVFKFFNSGEGKTVRVTIDGEFFGEYPLYSGDGLENTDGNDQEFDAVVGGEGYTYNKQESSSSAINTNEISEKSTQQGKNDQVVNIPGFVGNCILVIKDGKAYMLEADCPNQICVHHSAISHKGETIVCLPNRIIIEITD